MVGRRLWRWFADGPWLTRRQFFGLFTLLFALVTISLAGEGLLATANRHRLHEIQASRLASCRTTYRSFPEVFRPFLPAGPEKNWPQPQRDRWEQFKDRIRELVAKRCVVQIQPKGER